MRTCTRHSSVYFLYRKTMAYNKKTINNKVETIIKYPYVSLHKSFNAILKKMKEQQYTQLTSERTMVVALQVILQ